MVNIFHIDMSNNFLICILNMLKCPLNFNNIYGNKYVMIEHFEVDPAEKSKECIASLVPIDNVDPENDYLNQRNQNLTQMDKNYNEELSNYLNSYNTYLLNKSMLKNAPPASATQAQLALATEKSKDKYLYSKEKLKSMQKKLEKNHKDTNNVIKEQGNHIQMKGQNIKQRETDISDQSELISEKTKLINSRTRQIELGISKNLYKRNLMWFLIIINIIFAGILVGLFVYTNKNK